jgi:hypothetical protein
LCGLNVFTSKWLQFRPREQTAHSLPIFYWILNPRLACSLCTQRWMQSALHSRQTWMFGQDPTVSMELS